MRPEAPFIYLTEHTGVILDASHHAFVAPEIDHGVGGDQHAIPSRLDGRSLPQQVESHGVGVTYREDITNEVKVILQNAESDGIEDGASVQTTYEPVACRMSSANLLMVVRCLPLRGELQDDHALLCQQLMLDTLLTEPEKLKCSISVWGLAQKIILGRVVYERSSLVLLTTGAS
jgi:hypothetical protein